MDIFSVICFAAGSRASDVHIVAFNPPLLRIKGSLQPMAEITPLTPDEIDKAFRQLTTH